MHPSACCVGAGEADSPGNDGVNHHSPSTGGDDAGGGGGLQLRLLASRPSLSVGQSAIGRAHQGALAAGKLCACVHRVFFFSRSRTFPVARVARVVR